jgi:hypothetical protein
VKASISRQAHCKTLTLTGFREGPEVRHCCKLTLQYSSSNLRVYAQDPAISCVYPLCIQADSNDGAVGAKPPSGEAANAPFYNHSKCLEHALCAEAS